MWTDCTIRVLELPVVNVGCVITAFRLWKYKFCKDKPQFGGPGKLKQSCIKRKCLRLGKPKPGGKVIQMQY